MPILQRKVEDYDRNVHYVKSGDELVPALKLVAKDKTFGYTAKSSDYVEEDWVNIRQDVISISLEIFAVQTR